MTDSIASAEVARFPTFTLLAEALSIFMAENCLTPAQMADIVVRGIVSAQADGHQLRPLSVMWGETSAG